MPLGTLFDSRDYTFTASTNVRGYEWTLRNVEELYDDLIDAALGSLTNPSPSSDDDDDDGGRRRADYELSQIVLVPLEWDTNVYGLGGRYDVYDGQQRIVTLCLLFAALRESFRYDGGKTMVDTVSELTCMLNPPKVRKAAVSRMDLPKRDNEMLRRILLPELMETAEGEMLNLPPPKDRRNLSNANVRVLENYTLLAERVSSVSIRDRVDLLDYLVERVYFLVCVPETGRIARNIVMAQGKGMDHEAIGDFKGLVCFRYTREEEDMHKTFDAWDDLAAAPDVESDAVGRSTVSDACLLRASAALQTKIRRNDEIHALERWLRRDLTANRCDGAEFFERNVKPSSLALRRFRDGNFDLSGSTPVRSETGELGRTIAARLRFLRGLTNGVPSAKEIGMVVLDLLLRAEGAGGRKALTARGFDTCLSAAEVAALWMAVERPSALKRHARCFDMLEAIEDGDGDRVASVAVTEDERMSLRDALLSYEFGATASGKRLAGSILERLNAHLLVKDGEAEMPGGYEASSNPHVEHILPAVRVGSEGWSDDWPDGREWELWTHRLGNLALLSRGSSAREGKRPFADKRGRYEDEVWFLTRRQADTDVWDEDALVEHHSLVIGLAYKVWGL